MVLMESTRRRSLAARPTSTLPLGWNDTTDGMSTLPCSSGMADAWPSLTTATTVLVVPKSMPMTGAIALLLGSLERSRLRLELADHAVVPTFDHRTEGPHPA